MLRQTEEIVESIVARLEPAEWEVGKLKYQVNDTKKLMSTLQRDLVVNLINTLEGSYLEEARGWADPESSFYDDKPPTKKELNQARQELVFIEQQIRALRELLIDR